MVRRDHDGHGREPVALFELGDLSRQEVHRTASVCGTRRLDRDVSQTTRRHNIALLAGFTLPMAVMHMAGLLEKKYTGVGKH